MKSPLIDRQRLDSICEGSFENRVGVASKLVTESARIFCKTGTPKVVATYTDHAIVGTPEGKFFRAKIVEGKLAGVEEIQSLKPLTESDVNRLAYDSSKRAIDLLFEGRTEDAKGLVNEIFGYSDAINALPVLRESLDKKLERDSSWKRFLKENRARIKKRVGDVSAPKAIGKESDKLSAHDYAKFIVESVGRIKRISDQAQHQVLSEEYQDMASELLMDNQDIADIAMEIIDRDGGFDDLKALNAKISTYTDDVSLVTKYLGLSN